MLLCYWVYFYCIHLVRFSCESKRGLEYKPILATNLHDLVAAI